MHQSDTITGVAKAAIKACRFVDLLGSYAADAAAAVGISEQAADPGEAFTILSSYSALVETAEALSYGDLVKPATDGTGRAVKGAAGNACGRVLSRGTTPAGGRAEIRFVEQLQAVSGDGIPPLDYRTSVEQAISAAFRLRSLQSAPSVPEAAPTNKSSGGTWYIDGIAGSNANAGNAPTLPWKDAWKLPGGSAANGGTVYIAADGVYEYAASWADYKAGRVDASNSFSNNNIGTWTSAAATPTTIRPYYPRGYTTQKPRISWYALMQAADWTQETGISGGKVWSAAWVRSGNGYYNVGVAFGSDRRMGVAWLQQNTSGVPGSLVAAGQYAVDSNKVYVYVPDGSNPNAYYGEVRIFGGASVGLYSSFNGLAQNVRILGLQFELCNPLILLSTGSTNNGDSIEFGWCNFIKTMPTHIKHQQTFSSGVEMSISFHDNYCQDTHSAVLKLQQVGGTAGNTISWEVYRNTVVRGNLATCYGGALLYNQAKAGTKRIAWGNYLYDCRTGSGSEEIDGCGIYTDVGADKAIIVGNIFERCGKGVQVNSQSDMTVIVGNLAIDCGSFGSVTNTAGDAKTPSLTLAHNTYLWTGRIAFSSINAGRNIGGTGVQNWELEPAFEVTNQQAGQSGAAYNFVSLSMANNVAINMTGVRLTGKRFGRVPLLWTTTAMVAGNASCGMATQTLIEPNAATDYTYAAKYMHLIGSAADARAWLGRGVEGIARPLPGSPIVAAGASLSQQYQDIGGRNFAAVPTIGCYEVNA